MSRGRQPTMRWSGCQWLCGAPAAKRWQRGARPAEMRPRRKVASPDRLAVEQGQGRIFCL